MINSKHFLSSLIVGLSVLTGGCQSTPSQVESRPFDSNSSEAYNMANQTFLTRNESPLKDFTQQEIDTAQANLIKESGGDTSVLFGTLNLLTGNLTGIISVAGGTAANIANSDHVAAQQQWIVTLNGDQFSSALEAQSYAIKTIRSTAIALLESKGNVFTKQTLNDNITLFTVNGDLTEFGFATNSYLGDRSSFVKNGKGDYVSTTTIVNVEATPYMPFINGQVKGYDGYEGYKQYLSDLTSALPSGFMFYQPSFPTEYKVSVSSKADWDCSSCRTHNKYVLWQQAVPVIYKGGESYSFIKPSL